MENINASAIIEQIGVKKMAADLAVSADRIRKARRDKRLPASWFAYCEATLKTALPRTEFTFKINS